MKRTSFLLCVAGLMVWAGVCPSAFSQSVEVCTNTIRGTIRFNNTNPAS